MRLSILLLVISCSCSVYCKINLKALTESRGQEVIEIGTPIKAELPPGLEEEPSAEADDEENTTLTSPPLATKRVTLKTTTPQKVSSKEKEDSVSQENEESRIEKELAEIYKDTDYKAEHVPVTEEVSTSIVEEAVKPIGRAGNTAFKFQPNVNDKADVERFRTSIDEISCDKGVTEKLSEKIENVAHRFKTNIILLGLVFLSSIGC